MGGARQLGTVYQCFNPDSPRLLLRFQAAIRKYGVPDEEIFQTADLFERRNIAQVTLCIFALARIVSTIKSASMYASHLHLPQTLDKTLPRYCSVSRR